jgi:hypothetical protein
MSFVGFHGFKADLRDSLRLIAPSRSVSFDIHDTNVSYLDSAGDTAKDDYHPSGTGTYRITFCYQYDLAQSDGASIFRGPAQTNEVTFHVD